MTHFLPWKFKQSKDKHLHLITEFPSTSLVGGHEVILGAALLDFPFQVRSLNASHPIHVLIITLMLVIYVPTWE